MKEIGVYIHIPFCIKKCDYCDFVSYCDKSNLIDKYIAKNGKDYRYETHPNPEKTLRDRSVDNTELGRKQGV